MQRIFRANKMAEAIITNADTGDSTDVSRVYSRVGHKGMHVPLNLCLDFICVCNFCSID